MKRLILVTSPPACGKTYISKQLAKRLAHVVYLDKDTLITLSRQIFVVANQPYDRSSPFFETYIRDKEYECVLNLAFEAIQYDDIVLINAPFTREIRDRAYIQALRDKLKSYDAILEVIWVVTRPEIVHQRMISRNSDRDTWKLAHWDAYMEKLDFTPPDIEDLLLFYNSDEEEYESSMSRIIQVLEET